MPGKLRKAQSSSSYNGAVCLVLVPHLSCLRLVFELLLTTSTSRTTRTYRLRLDGTTGGSSSWALQVLSLPGIRVGAPALYIITKCALNISTRTRTLELELLS